MTEGVGPDLVIESAGEPEAFIEALEAGPQGWHRDRSRQLGRPGQAGQFGRDAAHQLQELAHSFRLSLRNGLGPRAEDPAAAIKPL